MFGGNFSQKMGMRFRNSQKMGNFVEPFPDFGKFFFNLVFRQAV
jgi:hypothetical protein